MIILLSKNKTFVDVITEEEYSKLSEKITERCEKEAKLDKFGLPVITPIRVENSESNGIRIAQIWYNSTLLSVLLNEVRR